MISLAGYHDIPGLVSLINSAYRGEASKTGWTTEAELIHGELRTDQQSLKQMMDSGSFLKYTKDAELQGCVYLEKQEKKLYLGMLSVSPGAQAKGIGKELLAASEQHALKKNCNAIIMNVISLRHELISWYERHGYERTGERKPFPSEDKFGKPVMPLEFIELQKSLPYLNC